MKENKYKLEIGKWTKLAPEDIGKIEFFEPLSIFIYQTKIDSGFKFKRSCLLNNYRLGGSCMIRLSKDFRNIDYRPLYINKEDCYFDKEAGDEMYVTPFAIKGPKGEDFPLNNLLPNAGVYTGWEEVK